MDLTSYSSTAMNFTDNQHGYMMLSRLCDQKLSGRFCDVTIHVKEYTYLAHRCVLASSSAYFENLLKDKTEAMEDITINSSQHDIFKIVLDYMYTGKLTICENTVSEMLRMANYFLVPKLKVFCSEYLERHLHPGNCYFVKNIADKWDLPKLSKTVHAFILANIAQVVEQNEITKFEEQTIDNLLGNKSFPMTEDLRFRVICNWIAADTMNRYKLFDKFMIHIQWSRFKVQTLYNLVQSERLFAESEWCMFRILEMLQERGLLLKMYVESLRFLADKIDRGENVEATYAKRESEKAEAMVRDEARKAAEEAQAELEARQTLEEAVCEGSSPDLPQLLLSVQQSSSTQIEQTSSHIPDASDDHVTIIVQPNATEPGMETLEDFVDYATKLESEQLSKNGNNDTDFVDSCDDDVQDSIAGERVDESNLLLQIPTLIEVKPKEEPKHKRKGRPVKLRISKSKITYMDGSRKRGRQTEYKAPKKPREHIANGNYNLFPDTSNPLRTKIMSLPPRSQSQIEMEARNIVNVLEQTWNHKHKQPNAAKRPRQPVSTEKVTKRHISTRKTSKLPKERTRLKKPKLVPVVKKRESRESRKAKDERHCEHCDFIADDESALLGHMDECVEANNVTHTCNMCTYSTPWNKLYLTHMKDHFEGPPYRCDCEGCDYSSERIQPLLIHRMRHSDERPYMCTVCEYKFRTKNNLQTHMRCHTGEKPWKCEVCSRCFATKGTLEQHSVTHSELRPYLCDLCGFSTKYQSHLIAHKRIHTGDVFKCQFPGCKYSTPKRSQLACHMRSHMSIRQHICAVCSRAFVEKSHLVRHERIHLEDKPFKCTDCDYSSTRRDKLKEHVLKYHGQDAVKCKTPYKPRKARRPNQNDVHLFAYNQTAQRQLEFDKKMEQAVQMHHDKKHELGKNKNESLFSFASEIHNVPTKHESATNEPDITQLKAAVLQSTSMTSQSQSTQDIIIQAAMSSAINTAVSQANDSSTVIPITLDPNNHSLLVSNSLATFVDSRVMQNQNLGLIGAPSPQPTGLVANACAQNDGGEQLHNFQATPVSSSQTQQTSTTDLTQLHGIIGMLGNMASL